MTSPALQAHLGCYHQWLAAGSFHPLQAALPYWIAHFAIRMSNVLSLTRVSEVLVSSSTLNPLQCPCSHHTSSVA